MHTKGRNKKARDCETARPSARGWLEHSSFELEYFVFSIWDFEFSTSLQSPLSTLSGLVGNIGRARRINADVAGVARTVARRMLQWPQQRTQRDWSLRNCPGGLEFLSDLPRAARRILLA